MVEGWEELSGHMVQKFNALNFGETASIWETSISNPLLNPPIGRTHLGFPYKN